MVATGLARYEFRHVPLHSQSEFAASVSECAADQDAFWDFHDRYMGRNRTLFNRAGAVRLAQELGLDGERLGRCIDRGDHLSAIEDAHRASNRLGIFSTPRIHVNGRSAGTRADAIIAAVQRALAAQALPRGIDAPGAVSAIDP